MNKNDAFGGYPLGHPKTTARLDRLLDRPEDARSIAAYNEAQYVKYLRRMWQEDAAADQSGS